MKYVSVSKPAAQDQLNELVRLGEVSRGTAQRVSGAISALDEGEVAVFVDGSEWAVVGGSGPAVTADVETTPIMPARVAKKSSKTVSPKTPKQRRS